MFNGLTLSNEPFNWEQNRFCHNVRHAPWHDWFPKDQSKLVHSLAIGVLVGLTAFVTIAAFEYVLESYWQDFTFSQDALRLFNLFKEVHPLLDIAWRAFWRINVVMLGPICEEVIFRGFLDEAFRKGETEAINEKVRRVALVAFIFGLCHLSPFQNAFSNVYMFVFSSAIGVIFGALKEQRNDLVTSLATHIIFNLCATL